MLAVVLLAASAGVSGCAAEPARRAEHAPPHAVPAPTSTSARAARTVEASGALSGVSPSGFGGVVVVPVEESDVVHLATGRGIRVTFPALPGVELGGRVVAVAPSPVVISGVTSYYVTVAVTGGDPRLRAGQTAVVTVPVA